LSVREHADGANRATRTQRRDGIAAAVSAFQGVFVLGIPRDRVLEISLSGPTPRSHLAGFAGTVVRVPFVAVRSPTGRGAAGRRPAMVISMSRRTTSRGAAFMLLLATADRGGAARDVRTLGGRLLKMLAEGINHTRVKLAAGIPP